MRCLLGFLCVCALGVMPLVGCSETTGDGGNGGAAGAGGDGGDGGSGGTGGAFQCEDNNDCLHNDCTSGSCVNGACSSNEWRDKVCDLGDGVHHGVCDGAGTCLVCNEDAQCDDLNDCTTGSCNAANGTCDHTAVADGTPCAGGTCRAGQCALSGTVLPCTEQGIRNAVAAGDGLYTFACDGPKTVFVRAEIVTDKDVILDGEGNLTVDGSRTEFIPGGPEFAGSIFRVGSVTELRGFTVRNSRDGNGVKVDDTLILVDSKVSGNSRAGIRGGTLTITNSTISGNMEAGVHGTLTMTNSTVSGNMGDGILGDGTITNSTVSGNSEHGITVAGDALTIENSTVSGNARDAIHALGCEDICPPDPEPMPFSLELSQSLVDGTCGQGDQSGVVWMSRGYNIESPGDTCGFDQTGDQPSVPDPMLGPLQDNGGRTMTHALLPGNVAIDQIPADECNVNDDQRGVPRPQGPACDVGAFELEQ